ncbi:hypothetical protein NQ314_018010 [Rhamnusium bicolor]|uniref:non-specific protein-tyrosine kinase n=1 Tax=Rhamnusium bicolor TaxID=1586634 RepID=A0AAV8WRX2_9CUCU|nr:hypothetical protein NQ314_018010 [Rhamnusium bicolor]
MQEGVRNKDDATSVHLCIEELQRSEFNSVLLYKREGDILESFPLEENDFCLIMMSQYQQHMLVKYGNNIIAVDGTYESMHKQIKYFYLHGTPVKRLDKGLHAVLQYSRDKMVEHLIKETKGKSSIHKRNILQGHTTAISSQFSAESIENSEGLYEFLVEAELQQYFNSFKNTLKITHPSQLKFTTESDLLEIGMSKPEMRRLRKYYEKHFPHNYLSKFKKLLTHRKQENFINDACFLASSDSLSLSKAPRVSSKHIIPAASITINKELGMGEFGVVQQGVWCNEGERIQGSHMLTYRVGDVITVLDKKTHQPLWKGATTSGKTGLFDPVNVVAYLGSDLPSSSFLRTDSTRSSARRKLRSEMISAPQGDFKHTGHVGLDGAYFGDLSFLGGSKGSYGSVPTQVVAPYRPHKDLEAAPLLEGDHVPAPAPLQDHEYHEISDEENTNSPNLDLGPSLMAEMEMMFSSLGQQNHSLDHEGSNRSNELREKMNTKSRKQATVKPISAHDQKTLDTAIAMANEITTRSMSAPVPTTPASPNKKKFSFKFPSVHEQEKHSERRNFSEEALSTSDLQKFMSSPSSLDEMSNQSLRLPLWDKASAEFYFAKSRELLSRPFPSAHVPNSSCRNLTSINDNCTHKQFDFQNHFQNLSFEDNYYRPHMQYRDRTLIKSESMSRKTYNDPRYRLDSNHKFYREHVPFNANGSQYFETSYVYYKTDIPDDNFDKIKLENQSTGPKDFFERPRTLSFSETQEPFRKRNGRSVKDRNRRRQSYNPRAYESSSSESDCISVGSADLDWRRRRRLSRLTASNSSIRSEMIKRSTNPFLKPSFNVKMMGRSPPPSNSILSGLSPTSSKVTQEAHLAYQGLVESPTNEISQLMVTNPLRILRSGQPVINTRNRSASVASTLPPKLNRSARNSVPDNLNGRQDFSTHATLPRPNTISHPFKPKQERHKEENPIPLPPRDRNKTLLAAKPRHTRKHPLIIPPTSLQRTLDKVNTVSPPPMNNESQHFEEQIESNLNALDEIPVEQDVVDGGSELSNLKKEEDKIHSHHVTTEKCLQALDQSDWDVMKAIKILKLQNVVNADLNACLNALENSMWDITKAAQWILQQDGEVTQV